MLQKMVSQEEIERGTDLKESVHTDDQVSISATVLRLLGMVYHNKLAVSIVSTKINV